MQGDVYYATKSLNFMFDIRSSFLCLNFILERIHLTQFRIRVTSHHLIVDWSLTQMKILCDTYNICPFELIFTVVHYKSANFDFTRV